MNVSVNVSAWVVDSRWHSARPTPFSCKAAGGVGTHTSQVVLSAVLKKAQSCQKPDSLLRTQVTNAPNEIAAG